MSLQKNLRRLPGWLVAFGRKLFGPTNPPSSPVNQRTAPKASTDAVFYPLPNHMVSWLSVDQYNQILRLTVDQLSLKGTIDQITDEGVIYVHFAGQKSPTRFYMDNLLRKCLATDPADWEAIVAEHVKILPINGAALTYIYKDFEFAMPLLKVQVKPVGFAQDILADCVYRQDFPQTNTFLVIDFEDALHYVRRSEIGEWEASETYLFDVALDNIAREKLDLASYALSKHLPLYALFNNDFAVAGAIELNRNAGEAIGPFGAVVSIPAKGSVFIHPLEADTVLEYIVASHEMVHGFFTNEVYTVNEEYYWYYEGRYSRFPLRIEGNQAYLSYPDQLRALLQTD